MKKAGEEGLIVRRFLAWNARERGRGWIAAGMLVDFTCFGLLTPAGLAVAAVLLDRSLELPGFDAWPATVIAGVNLVVLGLAVWGWAYIYILKKGRGSSLPLAPTRELVTGGPFALCRNPVNLGAMAFYAGIVVIMGSYAALALFTLFAGALLLYLKLAEEKELAARFGEGYLRYRARTPFILPRLKRKDET